MYHKRLASIDPLPRKKARHRSASSESLLQLPSPPLEPLERSSAPYQSMSEHDTPVVVDSRLTYRVGSPILPVLPLDTIDAERGQLWRSGFHEHVSRIMRDEKVYVHYIMPVKRVRKGGNAQAAPTTILVVSDASLPEQWQNWKQATTTLRQMLRRTDRDDFVIEIIDVKSQWGVCATPVEAGDHDTVHAWDKVRRSLLEEISDRDWISVDVIRRKIGVDAPRNDPTVCITARDADDEAWWHTTLPRLRLLLSPAFDIDLFHSTDILNTVAGNESTASKGDNRSRPQIYSTMESYQDRVVMGASIGVEGYDASGTAGTSIELCTTEGETIHCALTNHHVIAKAEELSKACPIGHSMSPDHRLARGKLVRITSPSDKDHDRFKQWKDMEIEELELAEQKRKDMGKEHQRISNELARAREDAEVLGQNGGQGLSRYLGAVWASSGFRAAPNDTYTPRQAWKWSQVRNSNDEQIRKEGSALEASLAELINGDTLDWLLNWALIKLQSPKTIDADIPAKGWGVNIFKNSTADAYCDIQPDKCYDVAKIGRSSGWSTGKIGAIGSVLKLRHDDASVLPVDLRCYFKKIVLAYGIISGRERDFILGGDSGSVVLLNRPGETATIVGLAFASNEATCVSYMTPMGHVIADIERVTGAKVTMPTRTETASGDIVLDSY
ncbi:hypothetical protein N0V83_010835 [Neocucurbitaria cava]|uniref:Uncharacterized protein n=1 Tax=Neocucurbitaria cava TaxID=798079 RepID=A0A9W8XX21_9PLEO|nr:hypothetical protein N0V83_010835 [Neocucurbitaria cava]